ncbi:MAG TPA: hypothetical protein VFS39_00555 [Nitrospira sp.]|nr:hypothetical protein [Nitrospira sp.]
MADGFEPIGHIADRVVEKAKDRALEKALISLAMTQRRLAHEYKRRALEASATGHDARYWQYRKNSDRLWCEAKKHLAWAQRERIRP